MVENKDIRIGVRFSREELTLLRQVVQGSGLKLSTYIRATVMKDVQAALPSDPLAQLKAREMQDEMGAAIAAMMVKAFKEAEREAKKRK
jgi:hypothetical protein